jgi:hypothetical protein
MSAAALLVILATPTARAFPVSGDETVLPAGTELDDDALDRPREIFNSEAVGGGRSYPVNHARGYKRHCPFGWAHVGRFWRPLGAGPPPF